MVKVERWHATGHAPNADEIEKLLREEGLEGIRHEDPPQTLHNEVRHKEIEILWVVKGSLSVGIDDEEIKLDPGDRIEIPAEQLHWIRTEDVGTTYYYAHRQPSE